VTHEEFCVAAYKAAQAARRAGAPIHPGIAAAQAALETGYGKSKLCAEGNNLFGIKATKDWKGRRVDCQTREFDPVRGWYLTQAEFRAYDSWKACFQDYGELIGRLPWYRDAVRAKDDPRGFLEGLAAQPGKEPGWATDPAYVAKVWAVARKFGLV